MSAGILHDERRQQMMKAGFEVAFIRVSRDVSRRIVAIGYRYVGPPEEAQAATQDTPRVSPRRGVGQSDHDMASTS